MSSYDRRSGGPDDPDGIGVVPFRHSALPSREARWDDEPYLEREEDGFNFWESLQVVLKRRWMILAILVLGVAVATVLTLRTTPLYRATATIEIQQQEAQIIEGANVEPTVVADSEYMATQYELLQSRTLAERVAERLDLPSDERYANQALTREERLNQAAARIVDNLSVSPEGRSRVVRVQYTSPYPREAARIANAVVENFIQSNLERRFNTTAYARDFLEERLASTKQQLEEAERRLVAYAQSQGIIELEREGASASLDTNSLLALNDELSQAQSARIEAEQAYREALENPMTRQMLESPDLSRLRQQRSELQAEYNELLGTFKPDYPDMQKLATRIEAVETEIQAERDAIIIAMEAAYRAALERERSLQGRVDELKGDVQDLRTRRIDYTILQREVDTIRSQYEALLQRLKEVSIASGIGSSQVSVVDTAQIPGQPFEPNLPRTLIQASILSLAFGIGLAFALNYIDDTIKGPEDLRQKLGLPAIGVVPKVAGKGRDIVTDALEDPKSGVSESFLSARTALQFATHSGAPKSVLITSTRPTEGKTSTAVALAMAFARVGDSVLIIDADMRKPSFIADAGQSIGLSGLLTQETALENQLVNSATPGLYLLPAGVVPPNPAELLSSSRLKDIIEEAESLFDIVIVDSPPVLSFADAPLLGAVCEGALIVFESGQIRRPAAQRTLTRLMESRTNLLGGILTKFDAKQAGYAYSYYYNYDYGGDAQRYRERKIEDSKSTRRKIRIFAETGASDEDRTGT